LLSEQEEVTVGIFRLAADAVEDLDLYSFKITDKSNKNTVDTFYFYHGSTLIGSRSGGATAEIIVPSGTVTIPKSSNVKITVKADMNKVFGSVINGNTTTIAVVATGTDVITIGQDSDSQIANDSATGSAAIHTLYKSRPYFSLASASPEDGNLIPNANHLLMVVDVEAADTEDITFSTATDSIIFQLSVSGSSATGTWTLKDGDGTTLVSTTTTYDTDSHVNFTGFNSGNSFTVPAGETKKLYVYGDTTDLADTGDLIQISLQDNANDITWSIDGSGAYNKGDIIFKSGIYGPSFVKSGS